MKPINLVILNITSYAGQCADATHVYGTLTLCNNPEVTIDTVEEWNVRYVGDCTELRQPLTLELAKKLDSKGGGKTYQRAFSLYDEFKDDPSFYETLNSNRFDTLGEIENYTIAKWKELNLDCPFISLYDGEKYDFKDIYTGEICKTKILYPTIK